MNRILFVCHGNICRSPMAEFIFKSLVKARGLQDEYQIESAAVSSEDLGSPIYPPARRCLAGHGIPFDADKYARRITREDYDRYDAIVCMDHSNLEWLSRVIPEDPQGKIRLIMSYAGKNRDVADPWYTGDFEAAYSDIMEGCRAMLMQA